MSVRLKVFCICVVFLYFLFLFYLVKKKNLLLRYSLLWMFAGAMFTIFALFPEVLDFVAELLGFNLPSNLLFTVCIGCGLIIAMGLTVIVSYMKKRLRQLSQAVALLENRIEMNEINIEKMKNDCLTMKGRKR